MNRLLTVAVAAAALWAAACSGGGSTIQPPPPTGNFTNASLNGTYAFVTSGEVITSTTEAPLARTGSFSADSHGNITGGVYDVVSAGGGGTIPSQPNPITGGSYTVNPDGRGSLTLNVNANGIATSLNFAFVLTSASSGPPAIASDGLLIDETISSSQASTGSGNFVLQNIQKIKSLGISTISGPYVFDFSGLDSTGSTPESLVGQFSATNSGVITGGLEDSNDGGALNSGSLAPGSLTADPANLTTAGRGTATIAGQTYAFYIVDSNRLRFIASNATTPGPMLTGDAVSQSSGLTSPTGDFAFIVAGSSANGGLVRVGRFTVSSTTVSKILMDVNNAGSENTLTNLSNGTITAFDTATGRGTLSFSNPTTTFSFVFYLSAQSDGVIQETTGTAGSGTSIVVADGSLAAQSGKPFSGSNVTGPYAMNWSGLVTAGGSGIQDEEDLLGQVKVTNLNLSGTADYFQFTGFTLFTDQGAAGSINFNGGDGAGDDGKSVNMNVKIGGNATITMAAYIVNPQLAFFVNKNQLRIVAGILKAQQ